ncbi:DNA mismatch repair protein Msh2 [Purpureocillium lavendulum]|uniref:DNA mismatch repair protein Msh2 n=1 Tax=Purpureocillium lavendulum TaxID=1247861 RepID=A0AB34FY61_9HYPO|nr:DNA mismatch repair protein Msh2 [Purpureocillium lavendulum]
MPRPAKRRHAPATTATTTPAQSISSFTRISKSTAAPDASLKNKAAAAETPASRKRKASSFEKQEPALVRRTISFPPSSSDEGDDDEAPAPTKRACRRPNDHAAQHTPAKPAPVKGKRIARVAPSRAQTAHRPVESTIIATTRRQEKTVQTKIDAAYRRKASKAKDDDNTVQAPLPPHLAELVRLNKAFLKTVIIQIAHSGSNVPIDLRTVSPQIARTWGKRQVTVEDVRRCIAIQSHADPGSVSDDAASPFIVADYGRGRVCVELAPGHNGLAINEDRLNRLFEENLRALCAERAVDDMADVDVPLASLSLADLPQAAITDMGASAKANPMLSKGHRALADLRGGILAKQQEREAKQQAATSGPPTVNADGSKMSLLDRLRLKQAAKANEAAPPSGPELQRRAALNRVADVAATISMLSLSNPMSLPRQAFTMAGILEKLRDSLRVPVSRDEGIACVRLIATEVAPEWLRVVTIGGRDNVVVQRNGQPVDRVIHERVQKLLAA